MFHSIKAFGFLGLLSSLFLVLSGCPSAISVKTVTHTVSFDPNGGSGYMIQAVVDDGSPFTVPSNPFTRPGYTFTRWAAENNGSGASYGNLAVIPSVTADLRLYAQWSEDHRVSFDANGGSGTMGDVLVPDGTPYTIPANAFSLDGWSFASWNTEADGSGTSYGNGETIASITSPLTLYARWGATRTIIFDANGGSGIMLTGTVGNGGSFSIPSNAFYRPGFTFSRWATGSDGSGTSYGKLATIPSVTADIRLYAIWTADHRVSFDPNGGSGTMGAVLVSDGSPFTIPSNTFSNSGWVFDSWNTEADGSGTSYGNGDCIAAVSSDITLYAQWGAVHTVTFNANGGSGLMLSGTVGNGNDFTIPSNAFYRSGYTFSRWASASDGSGASWENLEVIPAVTSDITLYAVWVLTRVIAYNGNGGTGSMLPDFVGNGMAYTARSSGFTRTDYNFTGWNTAAGGSGTAYDGGDAVPVSGDMTLYAQWEVVRKTVTLYANGGVGSPVVGSEPVTVPYSIPENPFARVNHTFRGWNTNTLGSGTGYAPGDTADVHGGLSLYAQWIVNRTVTFDANGGTGSMASVTLTDGSAYVIPSNGFSLPGNLFMGWNTASDGSGIPYSPSQGITLGADMTLYAQWSANTVLYIDFDEGQTLAEIFDTVIDPDSTLSIQSDVAMAGYALRKNLGSTHCLDLSWGEELTDFWVSLDFYVESTDVMPAGTFSPLVLVCDSDRTWGDPTPQPYLIGTPVYNCYGNETPDAGFSSIYPVSVMTPQTIVERFNIRSPVSGMMGSWHHLKYHVRFVGGDTLAGVDLWIDGTLRIQGIAEGDTADAFDFDLLRIWDHDSISQANTNIYLDNIGVYRQNPVLFP